MTNSTTVELSYQVTGEGEPLLLISGLGGSSAVWGGAVPVLKEHFTVITVDNRGTGNSPVPDGPYTIDGMADDIAQVLRQLDLGPVHAVGWSLGGSLLQSLLINHGALINKAVLLNAFPSYTPIQDAWLDAGLMLRRGGLDSVALSLQGIPWAFSSAFLYDHEKVAAIQQMAIEADTNPTTLTGFEGQAAGLRVYDSRADLPLVKNEVMVLVGTEDILTPPAQSIEMAELIPNAHLNVLPRGGHGMLIEYPAQTLDAIRAFLRA